MDTNLYTRHGIHWGFIKDDRVFKNLNHYIGWIDNDEIYLKNGHFLGFLVDDKFIMRNKNEKSHPLKPIKKNPRIPKTDRHPGPIPIIPNETFLKADEIDCLENL